jgi:exodeoxyribonuclease VII large subunit
VTGLARLLGTLSYKGTLARGYAVVRDGAGEVLTTAGRAQQAGALEIEFADGRVRLGGGGAPRGGKAKGGTPPPEQGSLF